VQVSQDKRPQRLNTFRYLLGRLKEHPLARIGPGLITGVADDDPSGIATYSQAGAQFGLNMLWTMPLAFPLMAVRKARLRVGVSTGAGDCALTTSSDESAASHRSVSPESERLCSLAKILRNNGCARRLSNWVNADSVFALMVDVFARLPRPNMNPVTDRIIRADP
jgi:hypothetical protein